jgi:DNA invertase Pin-like site-specific DNA recombinase
MPSLWPAPNSSAHRSAVNWTLVSTLYEDRGYSGSHLRRHGYQSLLADIKRGLIDVAVVHRFDRLTRNLSDFQQIVAEFNAHNVALVSVIQQLDMSHHVGRLAASKNGV